MCIQIKKLRFGTKEIPLTERPKRQTKMAVREHNKLIYDSLYKDSKGDEREHIQKSNERKTYPLK